MFHVIPNKTILLYFFTLLFVSHMTSQDIQVVPYYKNLSSIYSQINNKIKKDQVYIQKLNSKEYVLSASDIDYLNDFGLQVYRVLRMSERFEKYITNYNINAMYLLSSQIFKLTLIANTFELINENPKTYFIIDNILQEKGYGNKSFYRLIKRTVSHKKIKDINKKISNFLFDPSIKNDDISYQNVIMDILYNISHPKNEFSHYDFQNNDKTYETILKQKKKIIRKYDLKRITDGSTNSMSKTFANFLGIFVFRKGKLYHKQDFMNDIYSALEPLDILLEKSSFRLTDKFIPGFWGHVAINIGTKKQLTELDIWDHQLVKKYHQQIESGSTIVEALRKGVLLNNLNHFSNIDDFAQLRLKQQLSLKEKRTLILKALAQIGKKYDFNYNIENSETIICSELPFVLFEEVSWETQKMFGRYTITVDEVAKQGKTGGDFILKKLYLDGEKVDKEISQNVFNELDKMPKNAIRKLKKSLKKELNKNSIH